MEISPRPPTTSRCSGAKASGNERMQLFEQSQGARDQRGAATNRPAPGRDGVKAAQLGLAEIRQDGREVNFLAGVVSMNRSFDRRVAHETGSRSIDHVSSDSDLKRPQPECALPRRAGGVELVKGCYPAAAQLAAQSLRECAQGEGNASRLIAVVHVMQNHVLAFLGQLSGRVAVQTGDEQRTRLWKSRRFLRRRGTSW